MFTFLLFLMLRVSQAFSLVSLVGGRKAPANCYLLSLTILEKVDFLVPVYSELLLFPLCIIVRPSTADPSITINMNILDRFLPETLRAIVGDGSQKAQSWNRPLIPLIGPNRRYKHSCSEKAEPTSVATPAEPQPLTTRKPRMNPFLLFKNPDVLCILFSNAFAYALFMVVPATIASLFEEIYPQLNQTDIGLCYLPLGFGCIFSSLTTGKLLDRTYQRERKKWEESRNASLVDEKENMKLEQMFHVEKARLAPTVGYTIAALSCAIAYGWCLSARGPLPVALILQFASKSNRII